MIFLPAARAAAATGCGAGRWLGMPGLMISAVMRRQSIEPGSASSTPASTAAARDPALSSQATHPTPAAARARAVARPERASPSTTKDDPLSAARSIIPSPQLQVGKAGHRQNGGDDPEAK